MSNWLFINSAGPSFVKIERISKKKGRIAALLVSKHFHNKYSSPITSRSGYFPDHSGEQRAHSHHLFQDQCSASASSVPMYLLTLIGTMEPALRVNL